MGAPRRLFQRLPERRYSSPISLPNESISTAAGETFRIRRPYLKTAGSPLPDDDSHHRAEPAAGDDRS